MTNITKVYVQILEEGTPTVRGTDAVSLGNNIYKILATPYYNPEDELWEFPPESIVKCETRKNFGEDILLAVEIAI